MRQMMLSRFSQIADKVFRSEFLIMTYQGAIQLVTFLSLALFLFVGRAARDQRRHVARPVRRLQRPDRARERPRADPALALGRAAVRADPARPADDVVEQEPEQGEDHSAPHDCDDARGRRAPPQRRLPLRRAGVAGDPRGDRPRRFRPGTTVAIVGRSGSGKTTLVKLPCRPARADRGPDRVRRRRPDARSTTAAPPAHRLRAAGELPLRRHDRGATSRSATSPTSRASCGRRSSRTRTTSSSGSRSATTRGSARAACGSRAARRSGSRSPAPSISARRSCSSTRRRARSTPSRSGREAEPRRAARASAPRS